ncbi:hypothetical protein [Salisediminibacterium halotolerans]|uniref:Uncharacterized protein n=1 Tax=Salisediminibacterium halotolerans TaxID=517425 RepID=A0A1H9QH79_9BACI|nr:hypothetical protein [Salisediminibacterium haloalkalitolerans]SER59767.1 hypothetical protein SAMN05444126_1036 [Salisediminibacterium haloalkalitolerans]
MTKQMKTEDLDKHAVNCGFQIVIFGERYTKRSSPSTTVFVEYVYPSKRWIGWEQGWDEQGRINASQVFSQTVTLNETLLNAGKYMHETKPVTT